MRRLLVLAAGATALLALAQPAATAHETTLVAVVGPGPNFFTVETLLEKPVTRIKAGRYYFAVRDRSNRRNFHLRGPGIDRRTPVAAVHVYAWHLRLRKGVYTYVSDPQSGTMHGRFRVV